MRRPAISVHHLRAGAAARAHVIKRNGRRVPFDRDKLVRSRRSRCASAVDPERVERWSPPSYASSKRWRREISSEAIGEIVMEHLRQLDDVAYVRFASV